MLLVFLQSKGISQERKITYINTLSSESLQSPACEC